MTKPFENIVLLLASVAGTGFWIVVSYSTSGFYTVSSATFVLNAIVVVFLLSDYIAIRRVFART